jgi:putative ATP-dependent endonuclease of OLD family
MHSILDGGTEIDGTEPTDGQHHRYAHTEHGESTMIERVEIAGYRKFRRLTVKPRPRFNILVGDNDAGKSTLLEAIALVLTGRIDGRLASEEINPYWFNTGMVDDFFAARGQGLAVTPPVIDIEVFLHDRDEFQRNLFGAHNSDNPTRECAGVRLSVAPNPEYGQEIEEYLANPLASSGPSALPVEYYQVDWRTFSGKVLIARPKELTTAIIDSRTIRSRSGMDVHLKQILNDHLDPADKAAVSLAFRANRDELTSTHLATVNTKMAELGGVLDDHPLTLAMDQTGRGSWDASVIPHVQDVPFLMSGQGQQAAIKTALAMGHRASTTRTVMIEEPENHLSHTNLNKLLARVDELAHEDQQLFVTTHSSFVLNRLGLDALLLVTAGDIATLSMLPEPTISYFKKLPGYDTLRMALADRFVLVEGPSDELVFERLYRDNHGGRRPIEDGIDVISMRGLSLKHCLTLASALGKRCAALRDNDGTDVETLCSDLAELTDEDRRVFIGPPEEGHTLEPQILHANPDPDQIRTILGITSRANPGTWMSNNKTEAALAILQSPTAINPPTYIREAIEFISVATQ